MKKSLLTLLLGCFFYTSYGQLECARQLDFENKITGGHLVNIWYDKDDGSYCDILANGLVIQIDDIQYRYKMNSCGPGFDNVTFTLEGDQESYKEAIAALKVFYPNGAVEEYSDFSVNPAATKYFSSDINCLPPPVDMPTMGQWGLIILGLCLFIFGVFYLRQNQKKTAIQ